MAHPTHFEGPPDLEKYLKGGSYKCPCCNYTINMLYKMRLHLANHMQLAVQHKGFLICKCSRACRTSAHFHCIHCSATVIRKDQFQLHLNGHLSLASAPVSILQCPPSATVVPLPPPPIQKNGESVDFYDNIKMAELDGRDVMSSPAFPQVAVRHTWGQERHVAGLSPVGQTSYDYLSRQRRVYTEVKEEVAKMLQLKANKELIQEHVLQSTGTIGTLKDLHNVEAAKKPQHSENNLVPVLEEMKKEPGSTTEIVVSDKSELQAIFYQDPGERELSPAEKLKIVEARRSRERLRQKTRINIGVAFPRWRSLMKLKGFRKDAEVACYLLDSYERASRRGKLQAPAVSCTGGTSRSDDDDETDNSSDEEYYAPVCIGTSGELEKSPSVYQPVCEYDAEIIQVTVSNEEVPMEQQEWNSSLGKEVPEPPHIQQEQEGEQLQVQMLNALVKHQLAVEAAFNPKVHLDITDVQQQSVFIDEVPPEQHKWDPGVEDKGPEPPHIKEEQEEQWISQEGEQFQGQDEAGIIEFPFTTVHVKSEHHEDEPQSSQRHQKQTDVGRGDCGSKSARSLDSDTHIY